MAEVKTACIPRSIMIQKAEVTKRSGLIIQAVGQRRVNGMTIRYDDIAIEVNQDLAIWIRFWIWMESDLDLTEAEDAYTRIRIAVAAARSSLRLAYNSQG